MCNQKGTWAACALLGLLAATFTASAQLTIDGVVDKGIYNNTASYRVPTQTGYAYAAFLNGESVTVGVLHTITRPDYYELFVQRTETATSIVSNRLVRFLVNASERLDTEWGLPPQTPLPLIPSSSNELALAHLRLVAPQDFPAGYQIPVVAWVEGDDGHAIRANGWLNVAGQPPIQIRRGAGSGFLSSTNPAGPLDYSAQIQGVQTNKAIHIESSTTWTSVSGILNGNVAWPENARIELTEDLTVAAGATLTVGAGSIVRVASRANITNNGAVTINGTTDRPVVFMPNLASQPWGGFVQHANNVQFTATGAIFTGSGAEPCWFLGHGCGTSLSGISSHRGEQALISLRGANCNLALTDCAAIFLAGQLGHSVGGGGNNYRLSLTRVLVQRTPTCGEFTSANFAVNDSAFVECPDDSPNFVDGDNDVFYLVGGAHGFTNTLFGWSKDDAIDCGGTDSASTGFGRLDFESCWFEATFHEGNALSGYKRVEARDSVYLDCGQGFEDGYNAPTGRVDHCLFLACQVGVRHGDNYPSIGNYDGPVTATNCLLLHNHRDLFGYNWHTGGGWTNAWGQMFASNNWLTRIDTNFPNNTVWDPSTDAWRLGAFGAPGHVGIALATRAGQRAPTNFPDGLPVALSFVCTNTVSVDYSLEATDGSSARGTLTFVPGQVRQWVPLPPFSGLLRVTLSTPQNADLTGVSQWYLQTTPPTPVRVGIGRFGDGAAVYWGDASFRLQQSSELPSSNWTPVPGVSPVPIHLSDPRQFYRLIK